MKKSINAFIDKKEKIYFALSFAISIIFWLPVVLFLNFIILIIALIWLINTKRFEKSLYWNGLLIYSEESEDLKNLSSEIKVIIENFKSKLDNIMIPNIFIMSGGGILNAIATRILSKKYIILNGEVVNLFLERDDIDGLKMVIAHELWHHLAGHTSFWKSTFILPSKIIPFLWSALSRSMEYTADNIGTFLTWNVQKAAKSLIVVYAWTHYMANDIDLNKFLKQEKKASWFLGFLEEIYSFHPRLTKRVENILKFGENMRDFIG